jgi:hypothetical protein
VIDGCRNNDSIAVPSGSYAGSPIHSGKQLTAKQVVQGISLTWKNQICQGRYRVNGMFALHGKKRMFKPQKYAK